MGPSAEEPELTPALRDATVRNIGVMSVGTLLSRLTGLARVSVTLAALGLTGLSDTYNAANTTPNIVYELALGGILTSVFVPVFVDWMRTHGKEESWEAASRFLTLTLVVLSAGALAGAVFAPQIMRLYLAGIEDPVQREAQVELGAFFLRWFMPQIVFYGLGAVAGGILTANRRFGPPMFAPVLNNVAVIATMVAFTTMRDGLPPTVDDLTRGQTTLLAAGTTLGVVAMTLALWPSLRRLGFRWRPRLDWGHPSVGRLLRLARWVVVYVAANQLVYLVIISLNARIEDGGYTAYSQAFVFFLLPHAIVAVSIFTALLPGMSERWSAADAGGVRDLFSRGLRDTELLMLPAAAGYVALAGPIVALLAGYGAVSAPDADLLARTLVAFAVGLPFFSAFQLLTRAYYATQDSRTPALVNIVVGVVNLGANLFFAFGLDLGVPGLALGHAVSYVVGTGLLFWLLRTRLGGADERRITGTLARAVAAALLTGVAAFAAAEAAAAVLDVDRTILRLAQVGVGVAAGVLVFWSSALMFRIGEVEDVRRALRARFR